MKTIFVKMNDECENVLIPKETYEKLCSLLENPPQPNEALQAAMREYRMKKNDNNTD